MAPGAQKGVQDVEAARRELTGRGVQASDVAVQPWGSFVTFSDPDGNTWALEHLPTIVERLCHATRKHKQGGMGGRLLPAQ